jgi:hypothetical protein
LKELFIKRSREMGWWPEVSLRSRKVFNGIEACVCLLMKMMSGLE